MPIFDTTYTNRKLILEINTLVGPPFSFLQRVSKMGIGSRRMIIDERSDAFINNTNASHYLTYCNIELRPKGVIVHIHKTLDNFNWVLPFGSFQMFPIGETHLKIESEEGYLVLRDGYQINKKFVQKIISSQEMK